MGIYVVRVYDRGYSLLAELEHASEVQAGFGISKANTLTFKVPMFDTVKVTDPNFSFGNFVTVESDEVEPWDGDIVGMEFDGDYLSITAYDVVQRLGRRRSTAVSFKDKHAGEIAAHIIAMANQHSPTGLGAGNVYYGGPNYTFDFNYDSLYERLTELATQSKMEFKIRRQAVGVWTVDFTERLGLDKTASVVFVYGEDIEGNPNYNKDITHKCNSIMAFGKAPENASGDGDHRPKVSYKDNADIAQYGLFEDTVEFPEISDTTTLLRLAQQEVERRKRPVRTLTFTLNRKRGNWAAFEDGDIVAIQLPLYDFTGVVVPLRVMGRDINYSAGTMEIAGTVVDGEEALLLDMYKYSIYGAGGDGYVPPSSPGSE